MIKKKLYSVYIPLVLFLLVARPASAQLGDYLLLRSIHQNYTPAGGSVFKGITQSVTPVSLAIPTSMLVYGKLKKDRVAFEKGICSISSILVAGGISTTLKYAVHRTRPFKDYPNTITQYSKAGSLSFPSGHTTMAFASAMSLSLECPKWYVVIPSFAWAASAGYSRMYLGVHYPSDVLAGAVIGSGSALLVHYISHKLMTRYYKPNKPVIEP